MKVAIITASTAVYKGEQEDASGKVIRKMVEETGLDVVFMKALPTDKTVLSTVFQRMADGNLADLDPDNRRSRLQTGRLHTGGNYGSWTDHLLEFRKVCVHTCLH